MARQLVKVYVEEEELARLRTAAGPGASLSGWARWVLLAAADRLAPVGGSSSFDLSGVTVSGSFGSPLLVSSARKPLVDAEQLVEAAPAKRAAGPRKEPCIHRVPPESYCKVCDPDEGEEAS